jgi:hypothetical protein
MPSTWSPSTSRPATAVDVVAVGLVVDHGHPGTGRPHDFGTHAIGSAVRGVEDDVEVARLDRSRKARPVRDVVRDEPACVHGPPDPDRRHAGELVGPEHDRLEILLGVIGELLAGRVEHLEAVVLGRVVRGRDHDPGGKPALPGEEGERGGRHDADRVDVDAHARRARGDRGHEHVTRPPRVLADHERATGADDLVRGCPPERKRERGPQIDVRHTADAVRAKQAGHVAPLGDGPGRAAGVIRGWPTGPRSAVRHRTESRRRPAPDSRRPGWTRRPRSP